MGTMRIIRKDAGTFFYTGPGIRNKKSGQDKEDNGGEINSFSDIEVIANEFEGYPFPDENTKEKFLNTIYNARKQVDLCHKTGFCMRTDLNILKNYRCNVLNGRQVAYKCGHNLKPPCRYMRLERINAHAGLNVRPKNGFFIRCMARTENNA